MTTGWILINIAIAVAVTLIVAVPAVLVPLLLDRGVSPYAPTVHTGRIVVGAADAAGEDRRRAA